MGTTLELYKCACVTVISNVHQYNIERYHQQNFWNWRNKLQQILFLQCKVW